MTSARFPKDFTATPLTDYIKFKTVRRNYQGANGGYAPESSAGTSEVILYMPQKITEGISQNYRHTRLGPEASSVLTGTPVPGGGSPISVTGKPASFNPGDLFKRMVEIAITNKIGEAMSLLGSDALDANAILSATSGVIYNPMMEVLYDGPNFRKFNYQFMLFAKSSADAAEIYKIIRFFQYASVPSRDGALTDPGTLATAVATAGVVTGAAGAAAGAINAAGSALGFNAGQAASGIGTAVGSLLGGAGVAVGGALAVGGGAFGSSGRFIKQPPTFEISYHRGSDLHPYILSPERCVLDTLSIDYTPTGNYTILDNFDESNAATTVGTVITLGFTEIKIMYRESYEEGQYPRTGS